jgi:hypothetical protein
MNCTLYTVQCTVWRKPNIHDVHKWSNSAFKTVAKIPQIQKISRCYHEGEAIENRKWYYVDNKQKSSLIIPFHIEITIINVYQARLTYFFIVYFIKTNLL